MQQRVYEGRINNVDTLKQRLIDVWSGLHQNIVEKVAVSLCSRTGATFRTFTKDWLSLCVWINSIFSGLNVFSDV